MFSLRKWQFVASKCKKKIASGGQIFSTIHYSIYLHSVSFITSLRVALLHVLPYRSLWNFSKISKIWYLNLILREVSNLILDFGENLILKFDTWQVSNLILEIWYLGFWKKKSGCNPERGVQTGLHLCPLPRK